ncbi:lytic transglycosylase domain-containing protein [Nitratireductor indicus]|uniref:Lytic transglycosylase, catalytic n=1 Tax=Nitratireductor indicus C115 TaxID=1231190 RepID=K2NVN5_9HYPH|nr:transglycosylase SLT domain-containing protein [Nitratireductor indicus]EKF43405.1 lytic transglycosylase, catalytic [Nitratireductor indicus C115]MDS1135731.1 transglycosylase SLT domain-containing protein [Nitratireductor indicus]SFQ08263.1 Transglycosylase SLT domain-containing protein [Nitratireductor indicus]
MKIKILLAAAFAVSATVSLSHAEDTPDVAQQIAIFSAKKRQQEADAGKEGAGGSFLRDLIRGGRPANVDKTTTASISTKKVSGKSIAAKSTVTKSAKGVSYQTIVARYASAYGVPVSLAHAVIRIESNYRANARGRAGEIGLMQIKPSTARMLGYTGSAKGLYNPDTNVKYGMKYLAKAHKLSGGNTCGTILRYNAGHGAKRMNPVSSAYCSKVKRILGR